MASAWNSSALGLSSMIGSVSVTTALIGIETGEFLASWDANTRVASWTPSPSDPEGIDTVSVEGAEVPARARDSHPTVPP